MESMIWDVPWGIGHSSEKIRLVSLNDCYNTWRYIHKFTQKIRARAWLKTSFSSKKPRFEDI